MESVNKTLKYPKALSPDVGTENEPGSKLCVDVKKKSFHTVDFQNKTMK